MAQIFKIRQNSELPTLRMSLINDGKFDFMDNFNNAIQNADVTFSMKNINNGILKISKSKAEIVTVDNESCETKYLLQYTWKNRDVKEKGTYKAWFEIIFYDDLYEEDTVFPTGNLIVPIEEELIINVL